MRCKQSAGQLVGVGVETSFGFGNSDLLQKLQRQLLFVPPVPSSGRWASRGSAT